MSIFYKSTRIGKGDKEFTVWKFKTLKNEANRQAFANGQTYTKFGRFLRKTKLDELPALWNVLKGDMSIFGYRPEEQRTWDIYLPEIKEILSKHKPGFIDLASIHFFEEEKILQFGNDKHKDYWQKIFPMKMVLRTFYFENKCFLLKLALAYIVVKKMIRAIFRK